MPTIKNDIAGNHFISSDVASTARVHVEGLKYPKTDGTNGQAIITDGAGDLSFGTANGNIIVQEEGSTVTGGPHTTLNFVGGDVTATDGTGGVATITVSATPDQNLWETVTSDSGSAVANTTTDTLTIAGGTGISTAVSGDTLTITNTSTGGTGGFTEQFFAYRSVGTTITNNVITLLDWDTELYDPDANFNTSTSTYTIPSDGYYYFYTVVNGGVTLTADETLRLDLALKIGSTVHASKFNYWEVGPSSSYSTPQQTLDLCIIDEFSASDAITFTLRSQHATAGTVHGYTLSSDDPPVSGIGLVSYSMGYKLS